MPLPAHRVAVIEYPAASRTCIGGCLAPGARFGFRPTLHELFRARSTFRSMDCSRARREHRPKEEANMSLVTDNKWLRGIVVTCAAVLMWSAAPRAQQEKGKARDVSGAGSGNRRHGHERKGVRSWRITDWRQ